MSFFVFNSHRKLAASICGTALALLSMSVPAVMAEEAEQSLSRLESKLFMHDYPKDTQDKRLERLEKMVFGQTNQGSTQERLSKLTAAVPQASQEKPAETAQAVTPGPPAAPSAAAGEARDKAAEAQPEPEIADSSSYPALTAMEQKLYGKSFSGERLEKRVARLETKVFGKPGQGDISDRVDRLRASTGTDLAIQNEEPDIDNIPNAGEIQPFRTPTQGTAALPPPQQKHKHEHAAPPQPSIAEQDRAWKNQYGQTGSGIQEFHLQGGRNSSMGAVPAAAPDWRAAGGNAPAAPRYGQPGYRRAGSSPQTRYGGDDLAMAPPVAPPIASGRPYSGVPSDMVPRVPAVQNYGMPQPAPSVELIRQVSAMEYRLFHDTYTSVPLEVRVARLEATIFPGENPSINSPLAPRIIRLASAMSSGFYSGQPTAQAGVNRGGWGQGSPMNY